MESNVATHQQRKRLHSDKCPVRWQIRVSTCTNQDGYTITKQHNLTRLDLCTELSWTERYLFDVWHIVPCCTSLFFFSSWWSQSSWSCECLFISVVVFISIQSPESTPTPTPPQLALFSLTLRQRGTSLKGLFPIISGPLLLIAWWLYNLSNMMRWIIHQALWLPEEHHRQMGWVMSQAVETAPAQGWLVGRVNFISTMPSVQRVLWLRTGILTGHPQT